MQWDSRRFFCDNGECPRNIFTERLPEVAAPHARKTQRLIATLRALALACGGEVGAQLAQRLEMPTSPDTLLREIRRSTCESQVRVRVLGVDDWALRRGQRYGTILVDLEAHQAIDLLPERSSESFAAWLARHPEVEVISRDRGEHYIKGATIGAPQAVQVADRWHLLHNLHEALARVVERFPKESSRTARQAASVPVSPPGSSAQSFPNEPCPSTPSASPEQTGRQRRPRWQEKYEQLVELRRQKRSARAIARELRLDRSTVNRWIKAGCLPERAVRRQRSRIDVWQTHLETRWKAGCHNAVTLTTELRALGYIGSYDTVRRFVTGWTTRGAIESTVRIPAPRSPSAKSVAWWLLKPPKDRTADQQRFAELFCAACPLVAQAASLAEDFTKLVHDRSLADLDGWLARATSPEIPIEMRRFAKGLQEDLAAVQAALRLPWSNGQTEGQVNRVKLIKRQMYGRARFDLLRCRVLARQA
jgi:transposase